MNELIIIDAKAIKKYKNRDLKWLKNKAQTVFNEWVRLRDSDENGVFKCIACGEIKGKSQLQAGHYYSAGEYSNLRFNPFNVNGECLHCNYYSGDHLIGYRENLEKKIGMEELQKLDMLAQYSKRTSFKWDKFELIEIIEIYTPKVKGLRKTKCEI